MQKVMTAPLLNEATLAPLSMDDSSRVGDFISTYIGGKWYPLDPRVEDLKIEDIAHSLSMLCRYNGHCGFFYSVAEHCWLLSYAVPDPYKLEALVHDASEAYTSDIPRPFKYSDAMAAFRHVEGLNAQVIYKSVGLSYPESEVVKEYDRRIVGNEGARLLLNTDWHKSIEQIPDIEIVGYEPHKMERLYLDRYYELYKS